MEDKVRERLRHFPPHPTIMERVAAAVSFAILGAFFSAVSAVLIGPFFYGASHRAILEAVALGMMPSWVFFGVSLALLPSEWRYRQRVVGAIFLGTGLLGAYQSQNWLSRLVETGGGDPEPFQFFSRSTAVAIMAIAIGGFMLSKLTRNFQV